MKKRMRNLAVAGAGLLSISLIAGGQAMASTVCADGCDFTSIQAAIDAAPEWGEVMVNPGTYYENITFSNNKKLAVYSSMGPENTIIDGSNNPGKPVVSLTCPPWVGELPLDDGWTNTYALDGFTITNGSASQGGGVYVGVDNGIGMINVVLTGNTATEGGAVYVSENGKANILRSTITGNSADVGGGAYGSNGHLAFYSVSIKNNTATSGVGGGVALMGDLSNGTLEKNIISNNTAAMSGGAVAAYGANLRVNNNVIFNNSAGISGGGIESGVKGGVNLVNNTISANTAGELGGAIHHNGVASVFGGNNILWGNSPDEIVAADPSLVTMIYSDIQGGLPASASAVGEGNIDCDPQFEGVNDFHLRFGSCCIDTGVYLDDARSDIESKLRPIGSGYDIGAYEFECSDVDLDGFSVCDGDCNDLNSAVNPEGAEICGNGIDDNCDGLTDCEDLRACRKDPSCSVPKPPEIKEICDDGIDNDGDGKVDCADKSECRKDPVCQ